MKIITVAGTASRVGKTTVASYILSSLSNRTFSPKEKTEKYGRVLQHAGSTSRETIENFPELFHYKRPWSALKITIRHEGSCPRHTGCDTCDDGYEPFKILTSDDIIREKGKDTDRLSTAGASKVVWLQSDSDVEKAGIEAALACFDKEHNLVIEGNSFLRVHDADVAVLVVSPSVAKIKRSAKILLNKIDFVVINVHKRHTIKEIEKCKEKMLALGYDVPFYVINPYSEGEYSNQAFIDRIQDILFKS
jgi:molybdopterin-guanine dinucleotide biosynthesis protein